MVLQQSYEKEEYYKLTPRVFLFYPFMWLLRKRRDSVG